MTVPPEGWRQIRCANCRGTGLVWTGQPEECHQCDGAGTWWKHSSSGALAHFPGGPFCGRDEPDGLTI